MLSLYIKIFLICKIPIWQLPGMLNAELKHALACRNEFALSALFMTFRLIKTAPMSMRMPDQLWNL